MIQKTKFWAAHVAALKLQATSASEYAAQSCGEVAVLAQAGSHKADAPS